MSGGFGSGKAGVAALVAVAMVMVFAAMWQPNAVDVSVENYPPLQLGMLGMEGASLSQGSGGMLVESKPVESTMPSGNPVSINAISFSSQGPSMEVTLSRRDASAEYLINASPYVALAGDRIKFGYVGLRISNATDSMAFHVSSSAKPVLLSPYSIGIPKSGNGVVMQYYVLDFSDIAAGGMHVNIEQMKDGSIDATVDGDWAGMASLGNGKVDLDPEFYTASTVNITGYSDCISFIINATALGYGANCTSPFSGANCTSVNATINITQTGNLSLENCELRMNQTSNGQNIITSYGNLTLNRVNITTNSSAYKSGITVKAMSNFSMRNSFFSLLGWGTSPGQMGMEINSTTTSFNNNTVKSMGGNGIYLDSWSNGSVISNLSCYASSYCLYFALKSGKISLSNIFMNGSTTYGIFMRGSYDNTISGIMSYYGTNGITLASSSLPATNITISNITVFSSTGFNGGIYLASVRNITITGANLTRNQYGIKADSGTNNITLANISVRDSSASGMLLNGIVYSFTVLNSSFANNTNMGMHLTSASGASYGNRFESIIIENASSSGGLVLEGMQNSTFTNITVLGSANSGIKANNSCFNLNFTGITSSSNSQHGMSISGSSSISLRNVALSSNGADGLNVLGSSMVGVSGMVSNSNANSSINIQDSVYLGFDNFSIWNCTGNAGCMSLNKTNSSAFSNAVINKSANTSISVANSNGSIFFNVISLNPSYYDVFLYRSSGSCMGNGSGIGYCSQISGAAGCVQAGCTWYNCSGTLSSAGCAQLPNSAACGDASQCAWNSDTTCGGVFSGSCSDLTDQPSCEDTGGACSWLGSFCDNSGGLSSCSQAGTTACAYISGCHAGNCDNSGSGISECYQAGNTACGYLSGCSNADYCSGTLSGNCQSISSMAECTSNTSGKCYNSQGIPFTDTFLNSSYTNESVGAGQNITLDRQWYLDVFVNTSSGGSSSGANASLWSSLGSMYTFSITNASGFTARLNVTAYLNESGINRNYSQYVVNVSKADFTTASKNLTFSGNVLNKAFFVTFSESGGVVIVTPLTDDGSYFISSAPSIAFNVSDGQHSSFNCSVYVGGSLNTYNSSTSNITSTSITLSPLAEGSHSWLVNCTDNEGTYGASDLRTLTIALNHVLNIVLQVGGTSSSIYAPGIGSKAASSANATYSTPMHGYMASYASGILKSLVYVGGGLVSLASSSGGSAHSITLNQKLDGAQSLLAFTRGDWNSVESRISGIESGSFFSYPNPSFGFGLGAEYAVKLLLKYPDISFAGNMTLLSGTRGLTFSYNGTSGNSEKILVASQS